MVLIDTLLWIHMEISTTPHNSICIVKQKCPLGPIWDKNDVTKLQKKWRIPLISPHIAEILLLGNNLPQLFYDQFSYLSRFKNFFPVINQFSVQCHSCKYDGWLTTYTSIWLAQWIVRFIFLLQCCVYYNNLNQMSIDLLSVMLTASVLWLVDC